MSTSRLAHLLKEGPDLLSPNQLDVIDDDGCLGCGFIHPSFLVQLLGNSTPTKLFLAAPLSHVHSVTQDALARECEIYCTMALTLQFREMTWSLDLKEIRRETVRLTF